MAQSINYPNPTTVARGSGHTNVPYRNAASHTDRAMDFTDEPHSGAHQSFSVRLEQPWNGEPPLHLLVNEYYTPDALLFGRNHGPMLNRDEDHSFKIYACLDQNLTGEEHQKGEQSMTIQNLEDLATKGQIKRIQVTAALQCAGNRRDEMGVEQEVEGLGWGNGVVGNIKWTGYSLREVLLHHFGQEALEKLRGLHIEMICHQICQEDSYYGASIPLTWLLDNPSYPALIATRANGSKISCAHGGPMRIVLPGIIGARWVKWVDEIRLIDRESPNVYMQKDYKVLPSYVQDGETKAKVIGAIDPLYHLDLQSVICLPNPEHVQVTKRWESGLCQQGIEVKGYAVGGFSGSPIAKVEVTVLRRPRPEHDSAKMVTRSGPLPSESGQSPSPVPLEKYIATLQQELLSSDRTWAWCLWSAWVPCSSTDLLDLSSCAEDEDGTRQVGISPWNLRGVANNSQSRIENVCIP